MDFDIGTLLYVLITLVAVIVGVLGKKKKPAGTSPGGEARSGGSFLESFERALSMEPAESEPPDPEITEEPLYMEHGEGLKSGTGSLLEEYEWLMKSSGRYDIGAMQENQPVAEPIEVFDLDEGYGTDYFEIVKDFDAGTAVVYSAIINRVEY